MKPRKIIYLITFAMLLSVSCSHNNNSAEYPELKAVIDTVRILYVPDIRDDVFDITLSQRNGKPLIHGVTSVAEAKNDLLTRIRKIHPETIDSIIILPDENLGDNIFAVAKVSVADLRTSADYAGEMATQLILGTSMQILQNDQDWFRVKTPEGYVAWLQNGTVTQMNRKTHEQWESAPKVIFTCDYGFAYETPDENKQRSSDMVFGCLLQWKGDSGRFYTVAYPDGRQAYILKSQSQMYTDWKNSIRLTEESIVQKALELKGIPYSWGGTSVKAMDCSGFSKIVYLKHGIILKRDASQQAKTGIPVDISEGYSQLRPGDLLFFGKKAENNCKERIRHVAIYLGNMEFIHSAGDVHISSFDPAQPHYDRHNTKEFIRARRMLGELGIRN